MTQVSLLKIKNSSQTLLKNDNEIIEHIIEDNEDDVINNIEV